jgi:hypothetical protein
MKYVITYSYRDPNCNKFYEGIWVCDSLQEVEAFTAMVKRYGGTFTCPV